MAADRVDGKPMDAAADARAAGVDRTIESLAIVAKDACKDGEAIAYVIGLSSEARESVTELIALLGAMVETDRLVSREDIANLFWPQFVADAKKALIRAKGGAK